MKRPKRTCLKKLFCIKFVRVVLVAGTFFSLILTALTFSVACVWGGDEAVGFVLSEALMMQKDDESEAAQSVVETGQTAPQEETQSVMEPGQTAPQEESQSVMEPGQTVPQEETQQGDLVSQETEEREARELAERIAAAEYPFYIKVNREQCCVTVYAVDEDGAYTVPYRAMVCSTGLYNRTPAGTFHISDKYVWRDLNGGVCGQYASRVHKGVLFHSVPYYSHSKNALCTNKYNMLGEQASAGCIRLTVEDAKWIYDNCPSGTTVEVYDDENPGPLGKPEAVTIDTDSPNKGWDPTDPDENNPWREETESRNPGEAAN